MDKMEEKHEKEMTGIKKTLKSVEDKLTNLVAVSTKYVEEEFVIDVKLVNNDKEFRMIIDSGAPVSLASKEWFEKYVEEKKVDEEEIKKTESFRRFRLGKTLYLSREKVTFPIILKTDKGDSIKRIVTVDLIDSEEVTFLCG